MESHEYADLFPMLVEAELSELADSIKSNGLREPVVLLGGKVLDGRNRLRACGIAGVEPRFAELPDGQDPLQFVLDHNLHRRHLNESQRAMVGERLKVIYAAEAQQRMLAGKGDDGSGGRGNKKNPPKDFTEGFKGDSRDKAAAAVNVSGPLIDAAAKVRGPNAIPELAAAVVAGDIAVTRAARIAALPQEQQREAISKPHVSHNSGENEWYTPPQYIVAAREVMGEIDLDPASSEVAQKVVQAERFFTKDDDGLQQDWSGRVWMNPPYSGDLVGRFAEKLAEAFDSNKVSAAVVLVNNATDSKWFQRLAASASAICFPKGRIKYLDSTGTPANSPLQGQAILYFGGDVLAFQFFKRGGR
jgi:ParB family chromosome partitioning protein